MGIKLDKTEGVFRNELIMTADAKAINIDHTLVNLFMLLQHNGIRPRQRARSGESSVIKLDKIKDMFIKLAETENLKGFTENPEAVELWLRTNLANLVSRGNLEKEKLSSLRPIHIESYRVRNAQVARDYFTADQVYLMLGQNPVLKEDLKNFLSDGWDKETNKIENSSSLDIDSLGILYLIKNIKPGFLDSSSSLNKIKPLLSEQAALFCDDIRKLLVYKSKIPRNVMIEYLKTLTSFHLSLYVHKIIYLLPKMVEAGTTQIEDDWSVVVDTTDDFESRISTLAIADAERTYNSLYEYIRAQFKINAVIMQNELDSNDSESVQKALDIIHNKTEENDNIFKVYWNIFYRNQDEEAKSLIDEIIEYENTYFEKYVEVLIKVRGKYQFDFHTRFLDNLSQKNNERGFLAQGRSKKHPRRYIIGTRLLEALVQIQVLHLDKDRFITRNLSIEEMLDNLRTRYGLIINGLNEERFKNIDINTHLAFKENVEAFKMKLRQIGFFDDLSDAYILQKIRPRYELK